MVHWLETHMLPCFYKQVFGISCPGCGMQRSFIELLKGNFIASFKLYPALLPVIFTLCFTGAHLIFKFKNGADTVKYAYIITISVMVINYIIRFFI